MYPVLDSTSSPLLLCFRESTCDSIVPTDSNRKPRNLASNLVVMEIRLPRVFGSFKFSSCVCRFSPIWMHYIKNIKKYTPRAYRVSKLWFCDIGSSHWITPPREWITIATSVVLLEFFHLLIINVFHTIYSCLKFLESL